MELVLATRNSDKIREIEKALKNLPIKILTFKDFSNFPYVEESGKSLKENALLKAKAIAKFTGKLSLADDSGLEVEYLKGAPGVYSSRFAGENASYEDNNRKLLSLLKDVPYDKRGALFRCVIAFAKPEGKYFIVEGACPGKIVFSPRGRGGFGYDPIFQPEGYKKTFAQLSLEEKNRISHRAKALSKAREILEKLIRKGNKFLVGITGNMGCGKTTVSSFFEREGFKVIYADKIGHQILEEEKVKEKLLALFGEDVLGDNRKVSREKLRKIVGEDKGKLYKLNRLLHPLIKQKIWEILERCEDKVIFIEAALIFEASWDFFMDRIITVFCSREKQIERIRKKGFEPEQIRALLDSQLPQEEKIKKADFVIQNEKALKELEMDAKNVLREILEEVKIGCKS
ncbi:MAG TPA: XTP/dITP diphosphatase [Candidatus Aerophobetes bacterium]|uniref:Multifunctional fusion protein n=1 Tax=Aerophobetes bacterium TaxID=2030807 RepID=A0A7V5HZQ5_UNCAE|nr:XTP/dITP diphosphatase [Candidatus Aerophobetes bacterium]